jgi:hypothetical protein
MGHRSIFRCELFWLQNLKRSAAFFFFFLEEGKKCYKLSLLLEELPPNSQDFRELKDLLH